MRWSIPLQLNILRSTQARGLLGRLGPARL